MKKLFLLSLALGFVVSSYSQDYRFGTDKSKENLSLKSSTIAIDDVNEFQTILNPYVISKAALDQDIVIGETRYDLQTNNSVQNRIFAYPDGTIGATWTMGFDDLAYPGKGTGYNYFDGNNWGPYPTERLESERCGCPSYAPFGNGEIIASYRSAVGLYHVIKFIWREIKGEGEWTEFNFEPPAGAYGLLWPRMVTSGENHDVIHLIAVTTPTGHGGTAYQGQDGALLYSRSTDGGVTWEPENVILEGLGIDYLDNVGGDDYAWAEPKGDNLAFVVHDGSRDGIVMKSTDGGDSWDRMDFYISPFGGFLPDDTPKWGGGDANNAAVIDNNGMVHVVFGRMIHIIEEGVASYYPWSDGLIYWNENMVPLDSTIIGSHVFNLDSLENGGYLVARVQEYGGDSIVGIATYEASLTSMPQIAINKANNIFVSFSGVTVGFDNGDKNYRHVCGRFREYDPGTQLWGEWSEYVDYTGDFFHLFSECVFPSLAPYTSFAPYTTDNDYYHIVYQSDNEPGIYIPYQGPPPIDNNIVYLPVVDLYPYITSIDENADNAITYVSPNYPNPFNETSMVQVDIINSCNLNMEISNIMGQKVYELNKGEVNRGTHFFKIYANKLSAGLYFYTVKAGNASITKKMIVE
ncbi:MAG: T9SS type A sorting domain-containing protein [Bacteroidales bacterium]|nr:T9SS type A sorting domain-containing protein [Bacteroidales bacterium]